MQLRVLEFAPDQSVRAVDWQTPTQDSAWRWIDVVADADDADELVAVFAEVGLDPLAVRDAVTDEDLPKVDDFGDSLLVVLHSLASDEVDTWELHCFLEATALVTVHRRPSVSVDALHERIRHRPELATGGPDVVLARLADVVSRRLMGVVELFDEQSDALLDLALRADPDVIELVTAIRAELVAIRHSCRLQREALDQLRRSTSPLVSDAGRRRFSDVFDLSVRVVEGIETARTTLTETLDAYRGAEARNATEVSKVLTVYAAVMLPLSLVAGFFGMNFPDLPLIGREGGWIWVTAAMALMASLSVGVFVASGWVRRPSGRDAGAALGLGLVEAARAPVQLVGAVYEISSLPLRTVTRRPLRRSRPGDA